MYYLFDRLIRIQIKTYDDASKNRHQTKKYQKTTKDLFSKRFVLRHRENITAKFFKQKLNESEDLQTFLQTSDHYLGDRIKNTCPKSRELAQELANKMKIFASRLGSHVYFVTHTCNSNWPELKDMCESDPQFLSNTKRTEMYGWETSKAYWKRWALFKNNLIGKNSKYGFVLDYAWNTEDQQRNNFILSLIIKIYFF